MNPPTSVTVLGCFMNQPSTNNRRTTWFPQEHASKHRRSVLFSPYENMFVPWSQRLWQCSFCQAWSLLSGAPFMNNLFVRFSNSDLPGPTRTSVKSWHQVVWIEKRGRAATESHQVLCTTNRALLLPNLQASAFITLRPRTKMRFVGMRLSLGG